MLKASQYLQETIRFYAKAIVNLVDFACIMSRPTQDELKLVSSSYENLNYTPNVVIDVFKNRRGRWTQIRIWGCNDLGTCRRKDLFVTTPNNKPIEDLIVIDFESNKDEEMVELENFYNDMIIKEEDKEPILDAFENLVEQSQQSHANHDENFYITSAFENKVDDLRRLNDVNIGDLL